MKAVILAAGLGTRLRPYTHVLPKPLLPLGDRPILEILIAQLVHYGYDDIIVTTSYLSHVMETYFPMIERKYASAKFTLVKQEKLMGTAGGLSSLPGLGDEPFLVMNADVLTTMDYGALMQHHLQHDGVLTIGTYRKQVKIHLGVLDLDDTGNVIGYREKPEEHFMISMGVYIYSPEVLTYVPPDDYLDLPDLTAQLLADGQIVTTFHFDGYWLDIGRMEDFETAQHIFDENRRQFLPGEA
ncbi:MAG: nucleotidyltransferase family protein [Chloroflexi bacterium]|nr:MAG: nucleoside-diphosphate-sugar pyrophosphorylase [Phototrophicales bacterium]RMF77155.1 MAG: nucleotidyltransferase family protein [Chloroflexota bacterium]